LRADRKASNGSLGGPFLFNVLPLDRTKLSGRFGQFGRTTPTVWNWPIAPVDRRRLDDRCRGEADGRFGLA